MVLEEENCGSCVFYMATLRVCRRHPPVPLMLGVKQGLVSSGQEPLIMSYFPSMTPTGWCGEYKQMHQAEKDN